MLKYYDEKHEHENEITITKNNAKNYPFFYIYSGHIYFNIHIEYLF